MRSAITIGVLAAAMAACAHAPAVAQAVTATPSGPDTLAIVAVGRALAADSMRGRGPWTEDATRAARYLAARLQQLGARPVFGGNLLVPFVTPDHPRDTVYNVVGVLPNRRGSTAGNVVAMTAHLDHLGVGKPDASGDSIYNGFLDDALSTGMILDVARRYVQAPGDRPLVIMFFNLEEQGLLGAMALAARPDAAPLISRMRLLVGVDAGSPAGEAMQWQIMGGLPANRGAQLADSLARVRGWTTTSTVPRPINDVYVFAQRGVPIVFPIPGATWRGYTTDQRAEAMSKFDHYHQPADEWRPDFPLTGTAYYADWLWSIIHAATDAHTPL
ncbi:MAG TPA: M28 family peptidase [Gemmatimonadaceae bacterium]|jgi:Zn-dependent M28 family amino/carboxypeptidase